MVSHFDFETTGNYKPISMSALNSSDEYKPNDDDDDDNESCSSGVDENELEDGTHSEEDIEEDNEKVQFTDM